MRPVTVSYVSPAGTWNSGGGDGTKRSRRSSLVSEPKSESKRRNVQHEVGLTVQI